MHIRIIATPPGDAPEAIRRAWVGLVLPVLGDRPRTQRTVSIYSKRRSRWGLLMGRLQGKTRVESGYVVEARLAVNLLAELAPDVAQWWRQKAPCLLRPNQVLVFAAEFCEPVSLEPSGEGVSPASNQLS